MKEMMAISSGGGGGKYAFKDSSGNKNQALIDEDRHIQADILTMPDGDIIGAIENIPTIDVSDLATSANQDSLIAKFPFEDYQYMGKKTSGTDTYLGFKQQGGTGWYIMQKDSDGVFLYAYSSEGGNSWEVSWASPQSESYGTPPDS